jgi:ribosomal-protein-alanine N-acetyltransferase
MPRSDETTHYEPAPDPFLDLALRRMAPRDLDQVLVIERSFRAPWTRDMFLQELRQTDLSEALVAETGGRIAGYVLWWYVADEVHIVNVAVHESYRRNGVARRLLHEVFERARASGMSIATLEVRYSNAPAIHLYESLEFTKIAIRKSYYADNGEDALVMLKFLRPEV